MVKGYVGVEDVSRKIIKGYVGIPDETTQKGVARKIIKGYASVIDTYTPIEYIGTNGIQYIDTGYSANSNTKVEMQVIFSNSTLQECLFSGRDFDSGGTGTNNFTVFKFNGAYRQDYNAVGTNFTHSVSSSTAYTYIMDKNKLYENDVLIATAEEVTFTTTNSMFLLASRNSNGSVGNLGQAKLYYCKIWDNDTLVRDFIPAKTSNGIACLYDKIEGKAYFNRGGGKFTTGAATGEPSITPTLATARLDFRAPYSWNDIEKYSLFVSGAAVGDNKTGAQRLLGNLANIKSWMKKRGANYEDYSNFLLYYQPSGNSLDVYMWNYNSNGRANIQNYGGNDKYRFQFYNLVGKKISLYANNPQYGPNNTTFDITSVAPTGYYYGRFWGLQNLPISNYYDVWLENKAPN